MPRASDRRLREAGVDRSYHRGALRAQLIAASLDVVATEGVSAVSLRRLARDAGVSSGAPYHHFADRAELFAEIIVDGHAALLARLEAARAAAPDAIGALRNILVGYVRFAFDHPAHIRVMLRPELAEPATHPRVNAASAAPLSLLQSAIVAAQDAGALPPGDSEPALHLVWSLAIGYVTLWVDGPAEARCEELGTTPDEMVERVASILEDLLRRPTPLAGT